MKKFLINSTISKQQFIIEKESLNDCRHYIINCFDLSLNWNIKELKPLTVHNKINYKTWRIKVVGAGRLSQCCKSLFSKYSTVNPYFLESNIYAPSFKNNRDYIYYQR